MHKVHSIHHASIIVSDTECSLAFYRDLLGVELDRWVCRVGRQALRPGATAVIAHWDVIVMASDGAAQLGHPARGEVGELGDARHCAPLARLGVTRQYRLHIRFRSASPSASPRA